MKNCLIAILAAVALSACESKLFKKDAVQGQIESELGRAGQARAKPAQPDAVSQALLPPLTVDMPKTSKPIDPRFDLNVNMAPANQVFMALVSGTRYSMLVHPDIRENISVNLKDVTMNEALEAIRELYGYEYKIQGTRIYIQPVTVQTRLFQVNYLAGRRVGSADMRVSSGSIQPATGAAGTPATTAASTSAPAASANGQRSDSSRITTTSDNDFWTDIGNAIRTIIGADGGANVVVNAQAGVVLVRALPANLRAVEQYLKAMSLVVERQVMLEAKIIEVTLNDQYSTGINWAAFKGNFAGGVLQPGTTLGNSGTLSAFTARAPDGTPLQSSNISATTGGVAGVLAGSNVPASVFGLAFQSSTFASLLSFLESQGTVQVLSSPRIATSPGTRWSTPCWEPASGRGWLPPNCRPSPPAWASPSLSPPATSSPAAPLGR